jgi:hypothetical protein
LCVMVVFLLVFSLSSKHYAHVAEGPSFRFGMGGIPLEPGLIGNLGLGHAEGTDEQEEGENKDQVMTRTAFHL